jgi:Flp pilus assembly protein TadD
MDSGGGRVSAEEQAFTLPLDRFDSDLLPPEARTLGTPAFRQAVSDYLTHSFGGFGGRAAIVVDDRQISIRWNPESASPASPFDAAIAHLRSGRTPQGVQMLELLLTRDPDDVNLLFNLGIALSEARRLAEAEDHLNRAVELAPDFADALVALGVAQLRQQNVETAIETLERAIAIEPDNPWAHRNLGIAYLKLGEDPEEAVEHLQKAVERQPADQGAWLALGDAYAISDRRKLAEQAYRRAIEIHPHNDLAEVARKASTKLAQASL